MLRKFTHHKQGGSLQNKKGYIEPLNIYGEFMEIFFLWFLFSIAVALLANNKGRSGFGFFLLSIILSPLIGFVFAIAVDNLKNKVDRPRPDTHVRCPDCREFVYMDASKCKHCGVKLMPQ